MSGLKKRIITAIFFVLVVFGGLIGGKYSFGVLFALVAALCLWEFHTHILEDENRTTRNIRKILAIIVGLLPVAFTGLGVLLDVKVNDYLLPTLLIVFSSFFLLFIFELFTQTKRPFSNIASVVLGTIYIGVPFSLLALIAFRSGEYSPNLVICLLLLVWANDVFAYFVGSYLGKNKLFPRISPKKTWEGSLGGVIGTMLTALLCFYIFPSENLSLINWAVLGVLVAIFGSLGDLVESMFKRSLGIKDSGNLLPGHGGFLDRFDAFIFIIPFVTTYLWFC